MNRIIRKDLNFQHIYLSKFSTEKSQIKSHPTKSKEALIVRVHLPLHTSQVEQLIRKVHQKSSIGDLKALPLNNIPDVGCVVPEGNASPIWRVMRWPKAAAHPTSATSAG
jgi:hypothetical protein